MINKEFKHNIFGKTIVGNAEITAKSKETIFGEINIPQGFSGLQATIYKLATPTGTNSPWIKSSSDLATTDNLFYTGLNNTYTGISDVIQWQLDPTYLVPGITGAQHGDIYGLEFITDATHTAMTKKHVTDIIINISDEGAF